MSSRIKRTAWSTKARCLVLLGGLVAAGAVAGLSTVALGASAPPTPTIASFPANPTNSTSATFTYTSSGAVTFLCKRDGAASFTTCPNAGITYSGLAAGPHTFQVEAADKNNHLSSPASYSWVVDMTAPVAPSITAKPTDPSAVTSPSFSFADIEAGVSFLCRLDAAAYVACTSPTSYASLALGSHTFSVEAKDAAGNVSAATSYTWSIAPPTPTITAKPANPTNQTSASFSFTDTLAGVSYVCALDTPTFTACTSPKNYPGPLAQGSHTFQVKALSGANQSVAASYTWTVDTTLPPAPTITAKPASLSNTTSPSFSFTDSEAGVGFLCKVDAGAYVACASPTGYSGLAQGGHSFSVEAKDAAGNVSAGADSWTWTIDSIPPLPPVLTTKPDDPNGDGIANFDWTAEAGATFTCSIENGSFTACPNTSEHAAHYIVDVSNDGTHQFAVRAFDAAGNFSTTSYSWKVLHAINVVVDGDAVGGLLYPGGPAREIALTLHNPNNFPLTISLITVAVSTVSGASPPGCTGAANVHLEQSNVGNGPSPQTVTVPANSNLSLPSGAATRPTIRLMDTGLNQDACKNGTFTLSYLAKGSK
jgi:hypothetical protein